MDKKMMAVKRWEKIYMEKRRYGRTKCLKFRVLESDHFTELRKIYWSGSRGNILMMKMVHSLCKITQTPSVIALVHLVKNILQLS